MTKAQYLLSNYVRNKNCAKGYYKTQNLLDLEIHKNGQTSEKIFSHNCSRNGQKTDQAQHEAEPHF